MTPHTPRATADITVRVKKKTIELTNSIEGRAAALFKKQTKTALNSETQQI